MAFLQKYTVKSKKFEFYLCDVNTIACPLSRTRAMVSQSCLLATGSIPVVGSSKKTIGGSPIRATAVLNLRLLPPLREFKRK